MRMHVRSLACLCFQKMHSQHGAESRAERVPPLPTGDVLASTYPKQAARRACVCVCVCLCVQVVGINAIHVNPVNPWQFGLGAADPWARVYDVRWALMHQHTFDTPPLPSPPPHHRQAVPPPPPPIRSFLV